MQGCGAKAALVGQLRQVIPGPGQKKLGMFRWEQSQEMLGIQTHLLTFQKGGGIGEFFPVERKDAVRIAARSLTAATQIHGRST
jgi:hypothetical protein